MRMHGGPDARGPAPHDFSTNANAAGPCPTALAAVQAADATRYPDPGYTVLRDRLADFHGVDPSRILLAASASEFIQRITAVGARLMPGPVAVPTLAYGDYRAAALAWGRPVVDEADPTATLRWQAEPGSPLGQDAAPPPRPGDRPTVLDAVYAPLRLQGPGLWRDEQREQVFVLHSPNKALGLCGVRGAYAVAPAPGAVVAWDVAAWCQALRDAEASWLLSGQGVAMLGSWAEPATQAWLRDSLEVLQAWRATLVQVLAQRGFEPLPSTTPFLVVCTPAGASPEALRPTGVAVRDLTSFGLPGHWRLSAQAPRAVGALARALDAC
ncbi:aminotransferase class I/II-fold pyridoxal phosphate-dependent enzyme [Aquincola sp. J276]|uniref:aminotransferase class I/II-fold pyridoxal phosphate-dependent enzyme n=1 Tax=Aquincola sp. J276 TaxID=2898432 RepID=UPI002151933B|nr:aminotransferase class I/II-fold pyridoxal phosphate-dependent enzyme [Aquincola sp. J276]MCR5867531.1 aminotransferase class I/II-fold pyridoxal phosphate-dependent enzyme [Aquincola sp. J276]